MTTSSLGFMDLALFHPVVSHLADLFGNEADHENNDRAVEQQG